MAVKTQKERAAIRESMRMYKAEGHTMKEVSDQFGYSEGYTQLICKGIAPQPVRTVRNQYTAGEFDREANAIRYISERTPEFEYAGNFTGVDGCVDLKCKTCGTVTTRSFVTVRHGKAKCSVCAQQETEDRREQRAEQKRKDKLQRQKDRRIQKLRRKPFKQIQIKQCPICESCFVGENTYCSDKCRSKNKWMMKEGYRYRFPLEEVFERDNGICYLCGGICDWDDYEVKDGTIIYGNNYPSRDHVSPKSKGGENSWDNIRLAHRICNSRKGNSPL